MERKRRRQRAQAWIPESADLRDPFAFSARKREKRRKERREEEHEEGRGRDIKRGSSVPVGELEGGRKGKPEVAGLG